MNALRSMRWTQYTTGALLMIIGGLAILYPAASLVSAALFMGFGFLIAGLNHLVPYFTMRSETFRPVWLLPQGILDIILGILMISRIGLTSFMVPIFLAFWILLAGMVKIWVAFALKRLKFKRWGISLVGGIVLMLLAWFLASTPLLGALLVSWITGGIFISAGLLWIAEGKILYS